MKIGGQGETGKRFWGLSPGVLVGLGILCARGRFQKAYEIGDNDDAGEGEHDERERVDGFDGGARDARPQFEFCRAGQAAQRGAQLFGIDIDARLRVERGGGGGDKWSFDDGLDLGHPGVQISRVAGKQDI